MALRAADVCVLIPVFNGAATIEAALSSVLAQELHDSQQLEVVVVDDGSTDATAPLLARLAARDSRVRPVFIPHAGIVAALNAGLSACRAPVVARMDADDEMLPGRLLAQLEYLQCNPDVGLVAGRARFGGDSEVCGGYVHYIDWSNRLLSHEELCDHRFVESPFIHPTVTFRRDLVVQAGGYRDGDFPEDYELWLRLFEAWEGTPTRMAKLDRDVVSWNDRGERLTRTDPRYSVDAFYRMKTAYLARWLARHNPHHPDVCVIGAGRVARKRAELLREHGIRIIRWVDVDPRKIGNVIDGVRVCGRPELPGPDQCFVLSYVASRGAGDEIAEFLQGCGFTAGMSYYLVA